MLNRKKCPVVPIQNRVSRGTSTAPSGGGNQHVSLRPKKHRANDTILHDVLFYLGVMFITLFYEVWVMGHVGLSHLRLIHM